MLAFVLLIGFICILTMLLILNKFSGDLTNEFDKQTTKMKEIHYKSQYVTNVLRKAWSIMNTNETSANLILHLSSKRADFNRQQLLCKKRKEKELLMVEKNRSNLFPGLRARRLRSNGIDMLEINDSIGHIHS